METIRIVFYHTKDILKGKGLKIYGAVFAVSMMVMLYMEVLQLNMDVDGVAYMAVSVLASIVNMVITYILVFLFLKAVRKEKLTMDDIRYGISKSPIFIIMGLLLSLLQIILLSLCTLLSGLYPLYLLLYMIIYSIFVLWNGIISFGVYDGAGFSELLSGGVRILKDHALELLCASLLYIIWKIGSQILVPYLIDLCLDNTLYAGMIIPSIMKGLSISTGAMLLSLLVNVVFYAVQYACLLPMYTYLAKVYDEGKALYVPNAKRLPSTKR